MPTVNSDSGKPLAITDDGRALGLNLTKTVAEEVAQKKGWAFTFPDAAVTPTGAADRFCRIANLAAEDLLITSVRVQAASAENVDVLTAANFTSAGTHGDGTAANKNAASANLWTTKGTFESDVDISGDSGARHLYKLSCETAATDREKVFEPPIVIPNGFSLLLAAVTGAVALQYTVEGHLDMVADDDA